MPHSAGAHALIGLSLLRFGMINRAPEHLMPSLSIAPPPTPPPDAHLGLGEIALSKGDWPRADEHLTSAAGSDCFKGNAYLALSRSLAEQGRLIESASMAERALSAHDHLPKQFRETLTTNIEFFASIGDIDIYSLNDFIRRSSARFKRGPGGHILVPVNLDISQGAVATE